MFFFQKRNGKLLSNCNRNSQGQPSGWISCLNVPSLYAIYLSVSGPYNSYIEKKDYPPHAHFYMALYSHFCRFDGPQIKITYLTTPTPWYALFESL